MKTYICKKCKQEIKEENEEIKKCSNCGGEDFDIRNSQEKHVAEFTNLPKHEGEWKNQEKH